MQVGEWLRGQRIDYSTLQYGEGQLATAGRQAAMHIELFAPSLGRALGIGISAASRSWCIFARSYLLAGIHQNVSNNSACARGLASIIIRMIGSSISDLPASASWIRGRLVKPSVSGVRSRS